VISLVEILVIHDRVIEKTGGSLGVRDEGGLLSAIARPFQTFGGDDLYPTPFEKAAALLESICNNHPFVDGNKRTALVAAAYLLYRSGIEIDVPAEEGETFMLSVAQGRCDVPEIRAQLERWRNAAVSDTR
jgi:death-on-curing protein